MADDFDVDAMVERFRARARAVRLRGLPPVEGPERKRFVDQARVDFQDYAMIGDAVARLEDGVLTFTIDLRPQAPEEPPPEEPSPEEPSPEESSPHQAPPSNAG